METRSGQIVAAMTGNTHFAAPNPTVAALKAALTAFSNALLACKSGDRVKIADKNEKRTKLISLLHQMAFYVLNVSNGNEAIAVTSGFEISPAPQQRVVEKPDPLILENGSNPGEIVCKGKTVAGAKSYIFQYATLEEMTAGIWQSLPSTTVLAVLPPLTIGTRYYCRLAAVGSRKQLMYGDVTSRTAA